MIDMYRASVSLYQLHLNTILMLKTQVDKFQFIMTLECRQTSNIRHKIPNLNVSRLVLLLSLTNPLKPGVTSRMKLKQSMVKIHVSPQQSYCLLRCYLYYWLDCICYVKSTNCSQPQRGISAAHIIRERRQTWNISRLNLAEALTLTELAETNVLSGSIFDIANALFDLWILYANITSMKNKDTLHNVTFDNV